MTAALHSLNFGVMLLNSNLEIELSNKILSFLLKFTVTYLVPVWSDSNRFRFWYFRNISLSFSQFSMSVTLIPLNSVLIDTWVLDRRNTKEIFPLINDNLHNDASSLSLIMIFYLIELLLNLLIYWLLIKQKRHCL